MPILRLSLQRKVSHSKVHVASPERRFELCHAKTYVKTKMQKLHGHCPADQCLCFQFTHSTIPLHANSENFKLLVIFCRLTIRLVADLVIKPRRQLFSRHRSLKQEFNPSNSKKFLLANKLKQSYDAYTCIYLSLQCIFSCSEVSNRKRHTLTFTVFHLPLYSSTTKLIPLSTARQNIWV